MSNQEETITLWVDCPDCDGEGYAEIGPDCSKPASECCGGCYTTQECPGCDGGQVSITLDGDGGARLIEAMIRGDFDEAKEIINDTYFMNDQHKTQNTLCTLDSKDNDMWIKLSKN
tara:strand:+ start:145 stop:492 length:348 start_codon:yes stop_codon:yes gene_type:complete